MAMSLRWQIIGNTVSRSGEAVAQITEMKSGNYRWDGMGMYRENFLMKHHILDDVKYFYRYPAKRRTTITLWRLELSEVLKPCPFCGSEDLELDNLVDADDFYVSCRKCQVQQIANYTKEVAAQRWNTRPVEDALVEALKASEVMLRALLVSTPCTVSTNDSGKFRNINSFGTLKEVQAALKLAGE
jgi:Lar family restriction alleviation protein